MFLAAVAVLVAACGSDTDRGSGEIVVFAAASLTEAFAEIGDAFADANPDVDVEFNFAGSSQLVAQIIEGAPVDVYASADLSNMTRLTGTGGAADPIVFARNRSEIIVSPGNPLGIGGLEDLAREDVIVVTCATEVPCGEYAAQIFDAAGVIVTPRSYEENAKAVVTKVTLGEADAGIAYATDVTAVGDAADGVEIPADVNVVAEYPIAVTSEARNPEGGQAFVDFVIGDVGQSILLSHGFESP